MQTAEEVEEFLDNHFPHTVWCVNLEGMGFVISGGSSELNLNHSVVIFGFSLSRDMVLLAGRVIDRFISSVAREFN